MVKGSIQEEDITIINIYVPNIGAPPYIKQILTAIKGEINSNTIIVGEFNTPLSPMDRLSKMKIHKETQALNDMLNKMDLLDIYRTVHPKTTEYTFSSNAHGTFSRIDHIMGHKSSLGKFKKIESISSIFSDRNILRLDISTRKKPVKNTNTWRLNNTLLNNQEITQEIKEETKKYLETNDKENMMTQNPMGCSKSSSKREVYSNTILPQETRKISNKQPNLIPKAIRERRRRRKKNPKLVEGKKS